MPVDRMVSFKFLPMTANLIESSSKQGHRGASGKFVTIYPDDDTQFASLLVALDEVLKGQKGPYILSDLRYSDDSPVFARYGGILALNVPDDQDRPVPSIASGAALTLVPDQRNPRFALPEGVGLPDVLIGSYARSQESSASRLQEFSAIAPLHFSNAGGVYKAVLPSGEARVLREARPHAGLDGRNRCALQRQLLEEQVLLDLIDEPGIQRIIGSFTAWEHRYLELEYVEGVTLTSWVVRTIHDQQVDPVGYAQRAVAVGAQLIDIVERVHARGWAIGDLHTGNWLVGDDERVTLIDLEDATRIDAEREIGFRVFEFCADDTVSVQQADWFAVARCLMMLYVADWELEAVSPDFWSHAMRHTRTTFGAEAADQLERVTRCYPTRTRSVLASELTVDVREPDGDLDDALDHLFAGIEWSKQFSPKGSYPGDVAEPSRYSHEALATGRAGVVFAQHRCGREVDAADLAAMLAVAESWDPAEPPGLYNGLAGLALVLADLDQSEAALSAARRALTQSLSRRRLDLAEGQTGTVLVALEVSRAIDSAALRHEALEVYERLHRTVIEGNSAWQAMTHRRGLFWGLSGLALTDLSAYLTTNDPRLLERAITRLRADIDACTVLATGEAMVRDTDNKRVLPYVEWGSAGILLVATVVERLTGHSLLDAAERQSFHTACASDMYIYSSLDHGRAGIVATLDASDQHDEADRQVALLCEHLLGRDGRAFSIGDGLLRLSSDLSTGAAGVALAIYGHRTGTPYLNLPVSRATALLLADLDLPAPEAEFLYAATLLAGSN